MKTRVAPDVESDCAAAVRFARCAALLPPTLPPGLAERIVREVPQLAQMPAGGGAAARSPLRTGSLHAAPAVRIVPSPPQRRTAAGHRPLAGWAALAAGFATIALMLPTARPVAGTWNTTHAAAGQIAPSQIAPSQITMAQIAKAQIVPVSVLAAKSAVTHPTRAHSVAARSAVNPDSNGPAPIVAEPVEQPAPVQNIIAVAVVTPVTSPPSRPVYGPVDTEAPTSGAGAHGGLGAGMTPGYAFTGSEAGMSRSGASGSHPR